MYYCSRITILAATLSTLLAACGGGGGSSPPPNQLPVASAGPDQSAYKNTVVTLDGTGSADPDGNAIVYRWTQTAGPAVSLSSSSAARPTFTAPATSAALDFSLVVNDGHGDSAADTVHISIMNHTPLADAGSDAFADTSVLYTLSGLASSDADSDPLTYVWQQTAGPPVTLTVVSPGLARFTTPAAPARLDFLLQVSDGESTSQDYSTVVVQNQAANSPPVAQVGGSQTVPKRSVVALQGSGYDPEGNPVTYQWRQVSGPSVTLSGANTPAASFTAPAADAVLEFALSVNDGVLESLPARVTVTVANQAPVVSSNGILPVNPNTTDTISLIATTIDPDNDPLTVSYVWHRNGSVVSGQTGSSFPPSLTTRGDVIMVTVSASDGVLATSVDFSTMIVDSPPIMSATPPTNVAYGDNVAFTVSATDADNDPIGEFVARYGPAGFAVSGGGVVSWHAVGAMFDQTADMHWSVGLVDHPEAVLTGTFHVTDSSRHTPITRTSFVVPSQEGELALADVDGDGRDELITANSLVLSIGKHSGGSYVQTWSSPFEIASPGGNITAVAGADVTADGSAEVFVAATGTLLQLSGPEHRVRKQYTHSPAGSACDAIRVADLDGDGQKELICRTSSFGTSGPAILIFDAASLSLLRNIPIPAGGPSLAVGNVDSDPALEIVLAEGQIYDGVTGANEWLYGPGFGSRIAVADFDGDGIDEIVSIAGWSLVKLFDAVNHTPIAQLDPGSSGGLAVLTTADFDGDGRSELVLGDAQWGNVSVYKYDAAAAQFTLQSAMNSQNHGVSAIAVGNTNGDGMPDLVWGTGVSSSGEDVLVIAQYSGGALGLQWSSIAPGQMDGPFVGGQLARVTVGAPQQLMFLSPRSHSGYGGSHLLAMSPVDGTVGIAPEIATNWAAAASLDVGDFDGDGVDESFLGSADLYDQFIATYDYTQQLIEWRSPTGYATSVAATHADVTGDGRPDVINIGQEGRLSVIDVAHSVSVWQSTDLNGGIDVGYGDLHGGGGQDIVALTTGYVYVYSRTGTAGPYAEANNVAISGAIDLLVADVEGDAKPEILVLVGDYLGVGTGINIYDGDLHLLRTLAIDAPASTISLEPGTSLHRNVLLGIGGPWYYTNNAHAAIRAVDPVYGATIWESPAISLPVLKNSLNALDVNGDSVNEISYGTAAGMNVTR